MEQKRDGSGTFPPTVLVTSEEQQTHVLLGQDDYVENREENNNHVYNNNNNNNDFSGSLEHASDSGLSHTFDEYLYAHVQQQEQPEQQGKNELD